MAVKKKGLGKGLDSLIPDNKPAKTAQDKSVEKEPELKSGEQMMKINAVEPNREQPRKKFEEDALLELADSIKKNGYITSIKYHSDDLKMTMQIFVDRGRDPIDIIGKFEDLVAEYDIKIDMSDKGIREIKDTFSDYCEL